MALRQKRRQPPAVSPPGSSLARSNAIALPDELLQLLPRRARPDQPASYVGRALPLRGKSRDPDRACGAAENGDAPLRVNVGYRFAQEGGILFGSVAWSNRLGAHRR